MHRVSLRTGTGSLPRHRRPQAYGFTLIEIMVVVVILGIMAALVVPNIAGRQEQAQRTAVESDLNALANALEFYRLDNFTYPSTEQGLEALVTQPSPVAFSCGGYVALLLRGGATLVSDQPSPRVVNQPSVVSIAPPLVLLCCAATSPWPAAFRRVLSSPSLARLTLMPSSALPLGRVRSSSSASSASVWMNPAPCSCRSTSGSRVVPRR